MRILYANAGLDLHGGSTTANSHFLAVANALHRRGHDVMVSCARWGAKRSIEGLETRHLDWRAPAGGFRGYVLAEWLRFWAFGRHLRRFPPDVILLRKDNLDAAPLWWARRKKIPVVLEMNGDIESVNAHHGIPAWIIRKMLHQEARAFDQAAGIISVAPALTEMLAHRHGRRPTTIENGVDPDRFRPQPLPTGPLRVAFVGSLKPWHGVQTLIAACLQAGVHADIIGDGPERGRLPAHPLIRYHGRVDHGNVPALLAQCHVGYVSVEGGHGFSPLKVQEYLALGRGVLVGSNDDLLRLVPKQSAFPFPAGDAAALAALLHDLTEDRLQAASAVAPAGARGWDAVAAETEAVLEAAC